MITFRGKISLCDSTYPTRGRAEGEAGGPILTKRNYDIEMNPSPCPSHSRDGQRYLSN